MMKRRKGTMPCSDELKGMTRGKESFNRERYCLRTRELKKIEIERTN